MRRARPSARNVRALLARLGADRRGIAATEFALLAPVLLIIMAGTLDIGSSIYLRIGLNAAVNAGANYAIVNAASVNATTASTLADSISKVVANSRSTSWAKGTVAVNNGPTSVTDKGSTSKTGSSTAADSCYCPTVSGAAVTWGASTTCGSACTGGGLAGKFVFVTASRNYAPLIGQYSFSESGLLTAQTLVQVQ